MNHLHTVSCCSNDYVGRISVKCRNCTRKLYLCLECSKMLTNNAGLSVCWPCYVENDSYVQI